MFTTFTDTWFVSALPIGIALVMAAASVISSHSALRHLDGVIHDEVDLEPVRPAILLSMRLTLGYIALMLAFAGALAALVAYTSMGPGLAAAHMAVFGLVTLPVAWYARARELKLRSLRVAAQDTDVEAAYRLWLTLWDQPRVRLPY